MHYRDYPTHLGGELAGHDWIDLKPLELLNATMGSSVKAQALTELAKEQVVAAHEFGDTESAKEYTEVLAHLSRLANHQALISNS